MQCICKKGEGVKCGMDCCKKKDEYCCPGLDNTRCCKKGEVCCNGRCCPKGQFCQAKREIVGDFDTVTYTCRAQCGTSSRCGQGGACCGPGTRCQRGRCVIR